MLRHLSPLPSTQHSESKDLYDLNSFTVSLTACMHAKSLQSRQLFATPWTVAQQAPLSKGFSRQEYWSGLPCPPPGELPNLGIEPCLLHLLHWQTGSLPLAPPGKPTLSLESGTKPVSSVKCQRVNGGRKEGNEDRRLINHTRKRFVTHLVQSHCFAERLKGLQGSSVLGERGH